MKQPDADRRDGYRRHCVAVAEDWKECPEGRLDENPVGDVANAAPDPIAEGGQEAGIVAEACPRIDINTCIEIGLALGKVLEHAGKRVHAARRDAPCNDGSERSSCVAEGAR